MLPLSAKQVADYADVVLRWLATKTSRSRENADRCRILCEPRWVCASTIDFDYYQKCFEKTVTVDEQQIHSIIVYQSDEHEAYFEFKGLTDRLRIPIRTRSDLATRFSALLFPELGPNEILSLARNPLQPTERLIERQILVEEVIESVIQAEQAYMVRGVGIVIHNKRIEKRLVFRSRGPWTLRLSVELLNDDTYECMHDAGKLKWTATEEKLRDAVVATLSNGFAEVIRQGRRDSFDLISKFSHCLAPPHI